MTDLEETLKHLAFDVHHFRSYARLHREGTLAAYPPIIAQGIRYALLLHFRVLLNFFITRKKFDDDRCVEHFEKQIPEIKQLRESDGALGPNSDREEVARQLNKRLAHLTATRWEEEAPDMNFYVDRFQDVERRITAFQAGLPAGLRQCFTDELNDWERKHPVSLHCGREVAHTPQVTRSYLSDANGSPTVIRFRSFFKPE